MKRDSEAERTIASNGSKLQAALDTTVDMSADDRHTWLTAKYRGDADLQSEFISEAAYLSYMEAVRTGRNRSPRNASARV